MTYYILTTDTCVDPAWPFLPFILHLVVRDSRPYGFRKS